MLSMRSTPPSLYIEISDIQGIVLDELPARFDFFSHQLGKHFLRLNGVGYVDAQQLAASGVHRSFKKFLGIHLAQTFKAFDLQAAPADFLDAGKDFRDGEQRPDLLFLAFSFDNLEERFVLSGVMFDLEAFTSQFIKQLLDRMAL